MFLLKPQGRKIEHSCVVRGWSCGLDRRSPVHWAAASGGGGCRRELREASFLQEPALRGCGLRGAVAPARPVLLLLFSLAEDAGFQTPVMPQALGSYPQGTSDVQPWKSVGYSKTQAARDLHACQGPSVKAWP